MSHGSRAEPSAIVAPSASGQRGGGRARHELRDDRKREHAHETQLGDIGVGRLDRPREPECAQPDREDEDRDDDRARARPQARTEAPIHVAQFGQHVRRPEEGQRPRIGEERRRRRDQRRDGGEADDDPRRRQAEGLAGRVARRHRAHASGGAAGTAFRCRIAQSAATSAAPPIAT